MGAALKKNQDYAALGHLRWAAWGTIDIETLERMQRRNYINHVREELKLHGMVLECGGNAVPYYRILTTGAIPGGKGPEWSTTSANIKDKAFCKVCRDALFKIEPDANPEEQHA